MLRRAPSFSVHPFSSLCITKPFLRFEMPFSLTAASPVQKRFSPAGAVTGQTGASKAAKIPRAGDVVLQEARPAQQQTRRLPSSGPVVVCHSPAVRFIFRNAVFELW